MWNISLERQPTKKGDKLTIHCCLDSHVHSEYTGAARRQRHGGAVQCGAGGGGGARGRGAPRPKPPGVESARGLPRHKDTCPCTSQGPSATT